MRCGLRDTYGPGTGASDSTVRIDVTAGSPQWIASGDMAVSRVYHNLVLLPTGEVLATGGMGVVDNDDDILPRQRPEIWNPAGNGGAGSWSGGLATSDSLAIDPIKRGYHSTAILLPDARVLCAGGNHHSGTFTDLQKANIFCPPYLFKANGDTAVRPVVTCAPDTIGLGLKFSILVDNAASVSKACLIRSASTTHGFDQNQRYVPLTFTKASSPDRLIITAPATAAHAPPGDYLLFVVGSSDGPSVPSIAKWIRLEAPDAADNTPPEINDLTPDVVTTNSIMMTWTDPADDGRNEASGLARELLLRRKSSKIDSESAWDAAIPVCNMPHPGPVDTYHEITVTGLSCCQSWYFQLRARDNKPQLSALLDSIRASTVCYFGCGGSSAGHSRNELGLRARPGADAAEAARPSGSIVCDTRRTAAGGWLITLRMGEPSAAAAGLRIEAQDASDTWKTRGRFEGGTGTFGLCGLRDRGRISLGGNFRLERLAAAITRGEVTATLNGASHSRLGNVTAEVLESGTAALAPGDTLTLSYAPDAHAAASSTDWFALVVGSEAGALTARPPADPASTGLPIQFALHQNQPNPFRGTTTIRFDLPVRSPVRLEVFDLLGRKVRTIANRTFEPGFHAVEWDHRDGGGRVLAPGVYVYRLNAGGFSARRKMTLAP